MAGPLLVGGRYDGLTFAGVDGWVPGDDVGVLYLGVASPPKGAQAPGPMATTSAFGVPFAARQRHDPFDVAFHHSEVYLRCRDGTFRTPKMAAACS